MIKAISTCPGCMLQALALDPQPVTHSKGHHRLRRGDYLFTCGCGRYWLSNREETELMYRFLERANLLNPQLPIKSPESRQFANESLMATFVKPRVQRILARLSN